MTDRKSKPAPQLESDTAAPPHGDVLSEPEREQSTREGVRRESIEQEQSTTPDRNTEPRHSSGNADERTAHLGEEPHE